MLVTLLLPASRQVFPRLTNALTASILNVQANLHTGSAELRLKYLTVSVRLLS